jgi:hypothetical protein
MFSAVHPTTDIAKILRHVRFVPIVLKKSKMLRQQNSRKGEPIVDVGWQCPRRVCGKAAE